MATDPAVDASLGKAADARAGDLAAVTAHRRRLALGVVGVYALMLFGGTHWPKMLMPRLAQLFSMDKLCHFTGYMILTLLLLLMPVGLFREPNGSYRSPAWLSALFTLLIVTTASMLDEITQPLVERDLDPIDWACDISGALTALAVITFGLVWQFGFDRLFPARRPNAPARG